MFWFVNIAILLLAYGANKAIAGWLAARQKPALPGPFQQPVASPGQGMIVSYGTTIGEGQCTWFQGAKLVEFNVSSIDNLTRIGSTKTIAYMYKITAQIVIGIGDYGFVQVRNMVFGDKAISDQPLTQLYDTGEGVFGRNTFGGDVFVNGATGPVDGGAAPAIATFFLPNVFGGKGRGGGFTAVGGDRNDPFGGFVRFYRGNRRGGAAVPDAVMEEYLGAGNVPNYSDLIYVVLDDVNVGETTVVPPIKWVTLRLARVTKFGTYGSQIINERVIQGLYWNWTCSDINPAIIALDILTNALFALNQPESLIKNSGPIGLGDGTDGDFQSARTRLAAEKLGMSLRFAGNRQGAGEALKELERTVDGHIGRDPYTFQWTFRLNRNEAETPEAFAALPHFGKDELLACTLSKPLWEETYNEVTVEFLDAEQLLKQDTETVQNAANIAMTGTVRPLPNVQYFGITDRAIARKLAARDLKKVSIPLWRGKLKISRAAWRLVQGQVFRLTYDHKYPGVTDMRFRVATIDFGEETDNAIAADIVQDEFSFDDIQRPMFTPTKPPKLIDLILPRVTRESSGKISDDVGQLTITLEDQQLRTYEIAYRTQSGLDAPTDWIVVGTATPNTTDPDFPFKKPVTDTDLSGDHVFVVTLAPDDPSVIEYRIRYVKYGTAADPTAGFGEISGHADFEPMVGDQVIVETDDDSSFESVIYDDSDPDDVIV